MPDWAREIRRRLACADVRPEREAEIVEEIRQHLADRCRSLIASGWSVADAERSAWRELEEADVIGRRIAEIEAAPPVDLTRLEVNRERGVVIGLWLDTLHAVRALVKRPLLSFTAIVCIALSLGPAVAVLGIADALFFKPLPGIAEQDRLANYWFGTKSAGGGYLIRFISYANADDLTRGAKTVAAMAGFQPLSNAALGATNIQARLTTGAAVSANYFELLGVRLVAGRTFRADDDRNAGGQPVVVLSAHRARDFFGSSQAAVGQTVFVNSLPFTVIGVSPGAFVGTDAESQLDFWIPGMAYVRATHVPPQRWAYEPSKGPFYQFVVRMADSASLEQTTAELASRARALAEHDRDRNVPFQTVAPILRPGFAAPPSTSPEALRIVQLMAGVAALLVLLGMANVANLLIFRGVAGARDVATRKALGASSRRLVQLRLVESLILGLAGAVAGVAVALELGELFSRFTVASLGSIDVAMDWRVFAAIACLALVVAGGCGAAPALFAARSSVTAALGRGAHAQLPRATRLRRTFAVTQIALSLALLVGALLFLLTLRNLHAVDLGFDPTGVVMVPLTPRAHGYSDVRAQDYEQRLSDALRREPGVQSVALAFSPPLLGSSYSSRVYLPGGDPKGATEATVNAVGSEYFRALNLPLLRGRPLTQDEAFGVTHGDEVPVIVSETLARALFGSINVEGRQLLLPRYRAAPSALRIVGIAQAAHFGAVDAPPDPVLYMPLTHFPPSRGAFLLVRSIFTQEGARRVIARVAATIDPSVPVAPDRTFASMIDARLGQQRLFAWLLGLLAAIGFLLSAVGLYGLVAQTVTERRREFGIRLAIGADATRVMRSVLRQAAAVGGTGVVVGLLLAWLSGRVVESLLFGITSREPGVYAVATVAMALVVAVATFVPARAATRVDPIDVLKQE